MIPDSPTSFCHYNPSGSDNDDDDDEGCDCDACVAARRDDDDDAAYASFVRSSALNNATVLFCPAT
jgi:hypothetical protein